MQIEFDPVLSALQRSKSELVEITGRKRPPAEVARTYRELGRSIQALVAMRGMSAYRVIRMYGVSVEEMAHALMECAAADVQEARTRGYRDGFACGINRGLKVG